MNTVSERAYAKLNLTLDVVGKRADGYHEMLMVMQTVDIADDVTLSRTDGAITVSADRPYLPKNENNLAYKAAEAFLREASLPVEGVHIDIKKRVPVCAGMAGGSADAAAVLRGMSHLTGVTLSEEALKRAAESVGSDVMFCVRGGTALASGRGETLTKLGPAPDCAFVVVKPSFSVSTPKLFAALDSVSIRQRPDTDGMLAAIRRGSLREMAIRCFNIFEGALPIRERDLVDAAKAALLDAGAMGASMTGTGSAVYGVFRDRDAAERAYEALKGEYEAFAALPMGEIAI